jgi:calcineurin-like phosphoesterase family protein
MNKIIVRNWNKVVSNNDLVYFLGDFYQGKNNPKYWIRKLNGHISFIMGNHDRKLYEYNIYPLSNHLIIEYRGEKLLLIHHPTPYHKIPPADPIEFTWDGWKIHGHTHNHTPLVNNKNKCLNVSCENLNYTPIEIGKLLRMRNK